MKLIEEFRSLSGRLRMLVALSWSQWITASLLFALSVAAVHLGSDPGMRWNYESGVIWSVEPDGPADRAGVREGDRLAAVEGISITSALPPFYGTAASEEASLLIERDERIMQVPIRTENQWEARRRGFDRGGASALRSTNEYFRTAVNLWILLLSATILLLRPAHSQARVSAVALAYLAGGNALIDVPGFGALVSGWPSSLRFGIHFLDQMFFIGFLPVMVHFAMIFPRPFPILRRHRILPVLPYLVALPVLMLATLRLLRIFDPGLREALSPIHMTGLMRLYSPGMLFASLSVLALHFRHEPLAADRRRLRWVFISQVPPFATWVALLMLESIQVGATAIAIGRTVFWMGVAAGSLIFAWAIVRHRVFETKVLLRKSIQYALARGTLLGVIAIPILILLGFLWINRFRSLAELFSTDLFAIASILVPLLLLLQYRRSLLSWIDRRFFRSEYDSRQALVQLISMIQKSSDLNVLGRVTLMEIEKALHPTHISFWRLDPDGGSYRALHSLGDEAPAPPLPSASPIARMMYRQQEPIEIDLLYPSQSLRRYSTSGHFWIWLSVTRADLLVPLTVENELSGFLLLGERRSEEPYSIMDRDLLMTVARQLAITDAYSRLEELARQDPLTAALNRHAYYSLVERRGEHGDLEAGCVAIIDLDNLKRINDSLGHAAGDLAIRQVASAVRSVLRADDLVFRWGGDEFLVILFGVSLEFGRVRLSGLNELIAQTGFSSAMPISVSLGIAPFSSAGELSEAIERADLEMYEHKQSKEIESGPGL